MTGTAGRSRKQRCVTCTPSEWRAIKAQARAEGMDASTYTLSWVLDGEAPNGSVVQVLQRVDIVADDRLADLDAPVVLLTSLKRFIFPAFSGSAMWSRTSS